MFSDFFSFFSQFEYQFLSLSFRELTGMERPVCCCRTAQSNGADVG
jgi:hypothetical protein